jgi:ribonuclease P protein component
MQTFTKAERLYGQTTLDKLFDTGKSFNNYPFKAIWLEVAEGTTPIRVVISAPKRIYKRAVDRNRVKRMIREAYRKNKADIYQKLGDKKIHLLLIYTAKTIMEYKEIEDKIIITLQRITTTINS